MTHRKPRRSRRIVLFPLLLGALLGLAPRPAHAAITWEWFAEKVVSSLISEAVGYGCGYVFPQQGTDSSNASLADIETLISSELSSISYSTATTNYNGAISVWYGYYRGTTLASLQNNLSTLNTGSAFDTYIQNALSSLTTCGYSCAKMYVALGQIYVAAQLELYAVMKAINSLAASTTCTSSSQCSSGTCSNGVCTNPYSATDLANQLAKAETQANTVLNQAMTYKSNFEGQFGSTSATYGGWGDSCFSCSPCSVGTNRKFRSINYCFTYTSYATGSSQTLCPTSDLSWSSAKSGDAYVKERGCFEINGTAAMPFHDQFTCSNGSGQTECMNIASANGTIFRNRIIEAARDSQLGSFFYEAIAALQKIVNKDVAYCGDGVCQIGETRYLDNQSSPWCSDCTSSNFARATSLSMTRPSTTTTLLSAGSSKLSVTSWGDLAITDSSGSTNYWEAINALAAGSTFSLQSDGNLCIYNSSGTLVWQSDTPTLNLTTNPPTVNTLTLIDGVLYLTDQYGTVWWESDTDFHVHADLADTYTQPRQCWTKGTQTVLASNSLYNLVWESDGNLNVYFISSGRTIWTSNTSGSNPYMLCNQEDGNLVIYNTSRSQIWSTSTGGVTTCSSTSTTATGCSFAGYGGDLLLDHDQLRLVTAAGDPVWTNNHCMDTYDAYTWACDQDGAVATRSASSSSQCWTSSTTILSNDDAELDWTGSALVLYDKTPKLAGGTSNIQLWTPTSTSGAKVCYTSTGDLAIYSSSGSTVWNANVSSGAMTLAGCDLFLGDSSTAYARYATKTGCTYGANSTVWGGY